MTPANTTTGLRAWRRAEQPISGIGSPGPSAQAIPKIHILDLPFDAVYLIIRQLPPSSRVAFGLSCKAILAALPATNAFAGLDGQNLTEALQLLGRDLPSHFLCDGCLRLCAWNPAGQRSWRGQAHEKCGEAIRHMTFKCKLRKFENRHTQPFRGFWVRRIVYNVMVNRLLWAPCAQGPEVFFSQAHQVMNRHRLDVQFGLSLESLDSQEYYERHLDLSEGQVDGNLPPHNELEEWSKHLTELPQNSRRMMEGEFLATPPSLPSNFWRFSHESKSRIINDELFIRRYHRIVGPPVTSWNVIKLLTDLELPVCKHLFNHTRPGEVPGDIHVSTYFLTNSHFSVFQSEFDRRIMARHNPLVESCIICFTDYMVAISPTAQNWEVELTTYHCLGTCDSPYDEAWSTLTNCNNDLTIREMWQFRMSRTSKYNKPGGIRKQWLRGRPFRSLPASWAGLNSGGSVPFPTRYYGQHNTLSGWVLRFA